MRFSVDQIFTKIASTVNQEAQSPSATSSEYTLWLSYLNRAVQEWSEVNDWEVMRKNFFPPITGLSQATVALPADFKKLAGPVRVQRNSDTEGGTLFPDVLPERKDMYSSTDKYVYIMGDISSGFNMIFHPATLASGASVEMSYFAMPTSLASPTNIPVVNDSQFLVDRVIAYIFEARSDSRFQEMEGKARERLMGMIESINLSKYNSYDNPAPVITTLRKQGYRIGRD